VVAGEDAFDIDCGPLEEGFWEILYRATIQRVCRKQRIMWVVAGVSSSHRSKQTRSFAAAHRCLQIWAAALQRDTGNHLFISALRICCSSAKILNTKNVVPDPLGAAALHPCSYEFAKMPPTCTRTDLATSTSANLLQSVHTAGTNSIQSP